MKDLVKIQEYTIQVNNVHDQKALNAFAKALRLKISKSKKNTPIIKSEFIKKIDKSRADIKKGKGISMSMNDLESLWK